MLDATKLKDTYLDNDTYEALLNALRGFIDDAINTHAGMCNQSLVVEALGEIGGVCRSVTFTITVLRQFACPMSCLNR